MWLVGYMNLCAEDKRLVVAGSGLSRNRSRNRED